MARQYSNTSVTTSLVNPVSNSDTQVTLDSISGMPVTFPFSLVIDYEESTIEVVTVTSLSGGTTYNVDRGEDGTAAQAHSAGAVVVHGVTARDVAEPQAHIDATSNVHGVGLGVSVVGTSTTQTLTNKTISGTSNTVTDLDGSAITSPLSIGAITLTDPEPDIDVATAITALQAIEPIQRIATTVVTSDQGSFTTTETAVISVTAPVVSGLTYRVRFVGGWQTTVPDSRVSTKIREDSVAGTIRQFRVFNADQSTGSLFHPFTIECEYTASATESKTFVGAGVRQAGTGTISLDGSSSAPCYLYVDYIRG